MTTLILCKVTVTINSTTQETHIAYYRSTIDAVITAIDTYGDSLTKILSQKLII